MTSKASRRARAMISRRGRDRRDPAWRSPLVSSRAHRQNTAVRLTVIGSSPAWPNPGSAHSGYMLQSDGSRVRSTAGRASSVAARARRVAGRRRHRDHPLPPRPLGRPRALGLGQLLSRLGAARSAPALWVQPGGARSSHRSGAARLPDMFERTFDLAEYAPNTPFATGKLTVTPTRVPHYTLETYAFRVQANGAVLTYSGDSAPSDELVEAAARDADLFVCEATLLRGELDGEPRASLARRGGRGIRGFRAKRLLVTHRPRSCPGPTGSSSPTTASSSRCTRAAGCSSLSAASRSAFFLWLAIRDADAAEVKAALEDARSSSYCSLSSCSCRISLPGDALAAGRERVATRSPPVLRDGDLRARLQQRPAGADRRAPSSRLAQPRGSDARRPCAGDGRARSRV